jgi:Metallo-beta-lactamase superfamily
MSNAGFVVSGDAVVVFDALGTPALGRAMIAAIRKITSAPVRRVVVSHCEDRLEPLQLAAGIRRRQPHQRLWHLSFHDELQGAKR